METPRNIGGTMGKNDFLMLLSAQLRYQDPLEPTKDTEFVAQLAQFSTLEQMENMNNAMTAMANTQSYSLIGKFVVATAYIDNVLTQVPGIVGCIFTNDGVTYAQIGDYSVPVSTITEVYDGSSLLTPKMLIETSNHLIGRTVTAEIEETNDEGEAERVTVEGLVTRVSVDNGEMYAHIDDGSAEAKIVPVGSIYDIRQTTTPTDL
jgi:flagellar basal-body rod modification protein FlgD